MNANELENIGKQAFAIGCGLYAAVIFMGCLFVMFALLFG